MPCFVCIQLTIELARHPRGPLYLNPPPAMLSEHQLSIWRPSVRKNGQVCSSRAYKMIDWLRELASVTLIALVSSSYKCSRGFPWISCLKATQCCTVKFIGKIALKYVTRSYLISVLLFFSLWRTLPNAMFEVSRFAANWWTAGVAHWTSTVSGTHNSRSVMLCLVSWGMDGWMNRWTDREIACLQWLK